MKILQLTIIFSLFFNIVQAQDTLIKKIDIDNINDTVFIDRENSVIVCKLSTQNFKETKCKTIDILNQESRINDTKSGFEFENNWMRAGYKNQFKYDVVAKKIRLIGMSRYEFGNATNDGSGESSINLLTNKYIGNWNFYNERKNALIKIPTIKTKIILPKIYLEDFSDSTYFNYAEKCSGFYEKNKRTLMKK